MTETGDDLKESHNLSFEVQSPSGVKLIQWLLNSLADETDVTKVSIEIEANTPFEVPPQVLTAGMGAESKSKSPEEKETQPSQSGSKSPKGDSVSPVDSSTGEDDSESSSASPAEVVSESEIDTDETVEVHVCEYCGETFETEAGVSGHQRWCDEKQKSEKEQSELSEEAEEEGGIPEDFSLKPGTWKFRIASSLTTVENPVTPSDLEDVLAGTDWEQPKSRISETLGRLSKNNLAERQKRESDSSGSNPYEYWMTEDGTEFVNNIESDAQSSEYKTASDIGLAPDSEVEKEHECEICGEMFETSSGLGSHRYFKHEQSGEDDSRSTSESEADETDIVDVTERISEGDGDAASSEPERDSDVELGSREYRAASALYNASKPVVARDLKQRLEETEWEMSIQAMSAALGQLYRDNLATRDERRGESGNPFEYQLTDDANEYISDLIEDAEESGYQTFEEVITGK